MKVGYSGTRRGMTDPQKQAVRMTVWNLIGSSPRRHAVHHGDCIGGDAQFHKMCQLIGVRIVKHPANGVHAKDKANCRGAGEVRREMPPLERNKIIVLETDCMIIAPHEYEERVRSGTWATWRFAKALGRRIYLILPDGTERA
jgi:hypothetical protein